jgi:hypothetical protein
MYLLRNIPRNIIAIVARDPRERRINTSRNTTGTPNIPINRPARMRDPVRRRVSCNNTRPRKLVRRRTHTRKQPRPRNNHRPSAHRDQILQLRIRLLDEIHRRFKISVRSASAGAAWDQQDFEVGGCGGEGVSWWDPDEGAGVELVHRCHSGLGGDGVEGFGEEGDVDFGTAGEGEEGFVRAPDVEGFVGLEEDDAPVVWGVGFVCCGILTDACCEL